VRVPAEADFGPLSNGSEHACGPTTGPAFSNKVVCFAAIWCVACNRGFLKDLRGEDMELPMFHQKLFAGEIVGRCW
jgi:hypothetical protein